MAPPLRQLAAILLMLALASCSSDEADAPEPLGGLTLPQQTVVLPAATAKPRTTPVPVSTAPPAAAPSTSAGPGDPTSSAPTTTEVILALCELDTVIADIGPADEGYTFADLRCSGPWATIVAKGFDPGVTTDELVVLRVDDGRWSVVDGGGDTSCSSAEVPRELFVELACDRWERRSG